MTMSFENIKRSRESALSKLDDLVDERCEARIRALERKLRRFGFWEFKLGMGAWVVAGPPVPIVFDDGSESSIDPTAIFTWVNENAEDLYKPKQPITKAEQEVFGELIYLLDWWVARKRLRALGYIDGAKLTHGENLSEAELFAHAIRSFKLTHLGLRGDNSDLDDETIRLIEEQAQSERVADFEPEYAED